MNTTQMQIAERVLKFMDTLSINSALKFNSHNILNGIADINTQDIRSCPRINFIAPKHLTETTRSHLDNNLYNIAITCSNIILQNYQEKCNEITHLKTDFTQTAGPGAPSYLLPILVETEDHIILSKTPRLFVKCYPLNTKHYYIKNDYSNVIIDTAIFYTLPPVEELKQNFLRLNREEYAPLLKENHRLHTRHNIPHA